MEDDKTKKPVWSWGPSAARRDEPALPAKVQDDRDWWWDRYKFDHRTVSYDSKQGSASWRSRLGMMDDDSWDFGVGVDLGRSGGSDRMYSRALNQLQGSANIIGGTDNRISVRWSDGESCNGPTDRHVHLSPDGLLDENKRIKDEAIDALTGKVYMAATLRDTMSPVSYSQAGELRGMAADSDVVDCAVRIWEALETSIARHSILENWGGFAPYIAKDEEITIAPKDEVQAYLDDSVSKPSATAASIAVAWNLLHPHDRLKVPDAYDPVLDLVAKALAEEIPADERFSRSKDLATKIIELLRVEDEPPPPDEQPEGDDDDENDDGEGDGGQGDEDDKESKSSGSGRSGVPRVTDSTQFGGTVDNDTDSKLSGQMPDKGDPGSTGKTVSIDYEGDVDDSTTFVNMSEFVDHQNEHVYQLLLTRHGSAIRAIRDALAFHHTSMRHPTFGHRSGDIDESNLYRLSMGDDHIMLQNEIEHGRSISICLLVDESGSMMNDNRSGDARDVALILSEGLSRIAGLTVDVYGHSAEEWGYGHNGTIIREYRTPRNPKISSLTDVQARSENHDGYAIQHVANRFARDRVHADKRLMFVISDGEPLGSGYHGERAIRHVASVCHSVRHKLDVQVYGIGVADAYSQSRGRSMYGEGNFVVLKDVTSAAPIIARFVRQVASAMKRKVA